MKNHSHSECCRLQHKNNYKPKHKSQSARLKENSLSLCFETKEKFLTEHNSNETPLDDIKITIKQIKTLCSSFNYNSFVI